MVAREKENLDQNVTRCTVADDCAQIAKSGLKLPFESPHFDDANLRSAFAHSESRKTV